MSGLCHKPTLRVVKFTDINTLIFNLLFTLFGFLSAFVAGAIVFDFVGLKADLGALIIGFLIGSHPRSKELAKHMLGFKDFFLIAFFLNIGLTGLPDFNMLLIALIITLFSPLKAGLFMILLTKLNLRARTAWHVSISLSNYSEFGLIISILGLSMGILSEQWLIILALSLSISYLIAAPINHNSHKLFEKYAVKLRKLNTKKQHPDDHPLDLGDAQVIICGMGHVGRAAYHQLTKDFGKDESPELSLLEFHDDQSTNVLKVSSATWNTAERQFIID